MDQPGLFGGQWYDYLKSQGGLAGGGGSELNLDVPMPVLPPSDDANTPPRSSVLDDLLSAGEALWTSPNTILGLAAGVAGLPFGAKPSLEHGAVVFNDYPWGVPDSALTLGNTILTTDSRLTPNPIPTYDARMRPSGSPLPPDPIVDMGYHEEGHVHQAGVLGPAYIPFYLLQSALSNGPSPMEKAADTYGQTGTGWWPW
jgi:hypothetical protein